MISLGDNEYTLADGAAWIMIDGLSIRIWRNPQTIQGKTQIEVAVYKDGEEMDPPVDEIRAFGVREP